MIIIIAAGLSDLTLARYLTAHEIPFRIFDQAGEQKAQGYGLTLLVNTVQKLLPLLGVTEPNSGKQCP